MTVQDKAAERSILILELGRMLAPVAALAEKWPAPSSTEYRVTTARFHQDYDRWRTAAAQFVIVDGVYFGYELDEILRCPRDLLGEIARLAKASSVDNDAKQAELRTHLEQCKKDTIDAVDQVPITWQPHLLAADTPFSTYLKIRDAMGTAVRCIHYFDRYLDSDFFTLYLRDKDRSLEIRLVTTHGNANYGVVNVAAVSNLVAQEFNNYKLIQSQPSDMHDRNLRIDDNIFHLGASVSDAGQQPTNFTPADSGPSAHAILDDLIANGTEIT
ncbi:MAG: hypothetical protein OEQ39_18185 [Gammaproteobacteria bacterium]|nr:hypothetical protein [Gammaproteobacteria bacterium]